MITGASISLVKVIVCVAVPVLPHASVTVHVLVIGHCTTGAWYFCTIGEGSSKTC